MLANPPPRAWQRKEGDGVLGGRAGPVFSTSVQIPHAPSGVASRPLSPPGLGEGTRSVLTTSGSRQGADLKRRSGLASGSIVAREDFEIAGGSELVSVARADELARDPHSAARAKCFDGLLKVLLREGQGDLS